MLQLNRLERAIAPAPEAERVAFLRQQPYAHRGLHGHGVIENSQAAFRRAIAIGHGIELDVQGARDGEAMVFHDETLDRLTDSSGPLADRTAHELAAIPLSGSDETIVALDTVLALVARAVPVLIEIKTTGAKIAPLCLSVRRALEGYRGAAAIMSFNPLVVRWFFDNAPHVVRGLVVSEEGEHTKSQRMKGEAARWLMAYRAQPDFLAYDIRDLPSRFAGKMRAAGLPVLTWTVRDSTGERTALAFADEVIYERP